MPKIIAIEEGKRKDNLGIAIDIGTTTVVVYLVDLNNGNIIAKESSYNKQIICGEDVIARVLYCEEEEGLNKLKSLVLETINFLINEFKVSKDEIKSCVIAGNTIMTHLFLGIHPKYIRLEPYIPTANLFPLIKANDIGLNIYKNAPVYCLPSRSSYVGGDITADVLASGMHKKEELALLIDVGTNGEVVLGNKDWLVSCSCSAGPAFEGGEVEFGLRATSGAIEDIELEEDLNVKYKTIENAKPKGICGSGLLDLIAEMFTHGVIDKQGKIQNLNSKRIRKGKEGNEFVIAWKEETEIKKDIVITDIDIKNILRTKASMFSAILTLLKSMEYSLDNIERVYIAGGFGNYLDSEKGIILGLFPDIPLWKFEYIGNGSVAGATLVLLSKEKKKEAEEIFQKMTYFELSVSNTYFNEFTSALFLPHTDINLFPSVKKLLKI